MSLALKSGAVSVDIREIFTFTSSYSENLTWNHKWKFIFIKKKWVNLYINYATKPSNMKTKLVYFDFNFTFLPCSVTDRTAIVKGNSGNILLSWPKHPSCINTIHWTGVKSNWTSPLIESKQKFA